MKKIFTLVLLLFCKHAIASSLDTLYLSKNLDIVQDVSEANRKGIKTELENGYTRLFVYDMKGIPLFSQTFRKFSDKTSKRIIAGRCVHYYATGEDSLVFYISKKKVVGFDTVYYRDGKIALVYKNSRFVNYTQLWQYWPNGKLKRQQKFVKRNNTFEGSCFDENGNVVEFTPYQVLPMFLYGPNALNRLIQSTISYPEVSQLHRQTGVVLVRFSVNEYGYCSEHEVVVSSNYKLLDEEAIRVVTNATKGQRFLPGTIDGVPSKTYFFQPVRFLLQ